MLIGRCSFVVALSSCTLALGCDRSSGDLREWRPSDHRHTSESKSDNEPQAPQVTGSAEPPLPGLDEVTIATWRRACTSCHGQLGRGDGPQGPMVRARDLSDSAWQAATSDEQIKESITKGRGKMPAFPLPASTLENLLHLVRLFDRQRLEQAANAARAGSAPKPAPAPEASGAPRSGTARAHDTPAPRAANGTAR
jgi:cytochrome c oxidase cbb3-type subunit 3